MWRCGKSDLVVDHNMHRSTSFMANQSRQAKAFCNHALPCKGGITVQQNWQNLRAVFIA